MATSGSYDYSTSRDTIITDAMHLFGALRVGASPNANELTLYSRFLNRLIKAAQADGIGLWLNKEIYLFPQYQTVLHSIGPSGDHATLTPVITRVSTAASSGGSSLIVDSITGMSSGDSIGVELDGGSLQWTTINGAPSSLTITLTDVLTDDVAVDNVVYTYTTKAQRPVELGEVRVVTAWNSSNESGSEIELAVLARNEYMQLPNKNSDGQINSVYYDPALTDGELRVWPRSDNVEKYIKFSGKYPVQDFDAGADEPDFPQEWYDYLVYALAAHIGDVIGAEIQKIQRVEMKAAQKLYALRGLDTDSGSVYFQPDLRDG